MHRLYKAAFGRIPIGQNVGHCVDGPSRHIGLSQRVKPMRRWSPPELCRQYADQFVAVLDASGVACEALILGQLRLTDTTGTSGKLPIVTDRQREIAVTAGK